MALIPEYRYGGPEITHAHARARFRRGIAMGLGLFTLLAGGAIFGIWTLDRPLLPAIEMPVVFIGGFLLLLIASAFLLDAYLIVRRAKPDADRWMMREEWRVFIVLLLTGVGIAAAAWGLDYTASRMMISLRNDGQTAIGDFVIVSDRDKVHFGAVAPGNQISRVIHWSGGALNYIRTDGGRSSKGSLKGSNNWAAGESEMQSLHRDGVIVQVRGDAVDWK